MCANMVKGGTGKEGGKGGDRCSKQRPVLLCCMLQKKKKRGVRELQEVVGAEK